MKVNLFVLNRPVPVAKQDQSKKDPNQPPAPEELEPKAESAPAESQASKAATKEATKTGKRRGPYRPSHKATFVGLLVVGAILAINAVVIAFIIQHHGPTNSKLTNGQVTINSSALDKLGVSNSPIGDAGIQLTVGPNAKFNGNVQVAGNETIAGKLNLNSTFSAASASLNQLQAGNATLSQLNVNGGGTFSSLNVRSNLVVSGSTQLQGIVTISQPLTIGSNLSVAGSVLVGGALRVGSFQTNNLIMGGHVQTVGSPPGVSPGSALGSYGTATISGNDESGTVAVNAGAGASSGIVASVSFTSSYSSIPNIVVTPVGYGLLVYITRSTSGFTIYVSGLTPLAAGNGYQFDYMVEQ